MTQSLKANRRLFEDQTGKPYIGVIALSASGQYTDRNGNMYIRKAGQAVSGTETVRGFVYPVRRNPNAQIDMEAGRRVWVAKGYDGKWEVTGAVVDDLVQAGIDPRQSNQLDSSVKASQLIAWLSDLNSYPNGNDTVRVTPAVYRKPDGSYEIYNGNPSINLLAGYTPATETNQRVVCLWLDMDSNTVVVTASSELSQNTNLKLNTAAAMTYINECQAQAPYAALGIWSYIINGDDTKLTDKNKFHGLRGILGVGSGQLIGYANPVVVNTIIPAGREEIMKGEIVVNSGVELTVNGVLWNE